MQSEPDTTQGTSTPSPSIAPAEPVSAPVVLDIQSVEIGLQSTINSAGGEHG